MESIIPILGAVFFLAFLANKLNRKDEEPVIHLYDGRVADMYNKQENEEMNREQKAEKPDTLGLMFNTHTTNSVASHRQKNRRPVGFTTSSTTNK